MTSASIITVTYNSADTLRHFWSSFDSASTEWIVVDNASTDGSAETAAQLGAQVVPSERNLGFSAANNLGAAKASGDVLVFCNPDVTVTEDGLAHLCSQARSTNALVAPQLINSDGSFQENGRGAPFPHRKLMHMLRGTGGSRERYTRIVDTDELVPVVWVMGAAVAMTREVFQHIGGWDAGFFIYYEDADISLRALSRGVPTYVDGRVNWVHGWARETRRGFSRNAWKNEVASGTRFYLRHPYSIIPVGSKGRALRSADRA